MVKNLKFNKEQQSLINRLLSIQVTKDLIKTGQDNEFFFTVLVLKRDYRILLATPTIKAKENFINNLNDFFINWVEFTDKYCTKYDNN